MEHPMRLFTKIAAGTSLTIGIPIIVLTTLEINNLKHSVQDKMLKTQNLRALYINFPTALL
jgi:hypothetical protein